MYICMCVICAYVTTIIEELMNLTGSGVLRRGVRGGEGEGEIM